MANHGTRARVDARASLKPLLALGVLGLLLAGPVHAVDDADDLADLSLEQLMNMDVTSVSRREEKLSEAAAAIERGVYARLTLRR